MKNIILFDSEVRHQLLPLTFTRPVADLRCGILTIGRKWEKVLCGQVSHLCEDYLCEKFPINIADDNLLIEGSVLPSAALCEKISSLKSGETLTQQSGLIAARLDRNQLLQFINSRSTINNGTEIEIPVKRVTELWHLFLYNSEELHGDFELLTKGRGSELLSPTNRVIGDPSRIFLEEGAVVECSVLNVKEGPVYLGYGAEIMEGCMIRGGLALCDHAQLKMGSKIYGATTLGPNCRGGGEISNSVMLANSNKGHDGFLGNSVLGEWCNIGADTNTSNLKNTYEQVKLWSYSQKRFVQTGQQFVGLIMGDHSKAGINTMFNTGTVVGVASNIYGAGFPRNFVPSYAWGGHEGFITHRFEQAMKTAEIVYGRRKMEFTEKDRQILKHIFEITAEERVWENARV